MTKPTSLFKYRDFNKGSIELLLNKELWFAKPDSLNDPFECQLTYSSVLEAIWKELNIPKDRQKIVEDKLRDYLSEIGICSFSRTRKNQLMWAHYANEHYGFCIGFNEKKLLSSEVKVKSMDVDYQSELPYKGVVERFSFFENHPDTNNEFQIASDILYSIIATKYSNWKYEKERRLVRFQYGALKFEPNAVNSIAFGLRMSERDKETLKKLLSSEEWRHVKWYQAERSKEKFALEFNEIKM